MEELNSEEMNNVEGGACYKNEVKRAGTNSIDFFLKGGKNQGFVKIEKVWVNSQAQKVNYDIRTPKGTCEVRLSNGIVVKLQVSSLNKGTIRLIRNSTLINAVEVSWEAIDHGARMRKRLKGYF